jgi:hypothetical protein
MKLILSFVFALLVAIPALADLQLGTYKMEGANPDGRAYAGTVTIEQNGLNYKLHWTLGDAGQQQQYGQGILQDGILSVSYLDVSGQDYGVASFKVVSDTRLEGKWASFESGEQGTENLEFSSK